MRLDRWLSTIGTGSRSEVKDLIRNGGIAVDGKTVRDPSASFDPETSALTVCGRAADGRVTRHVMLYKPSGLLTAARDAKQPTVMDLLPDVYRKIGCMPVGRLDKDTTGLLLLTCDGEMNHRLLAPGRHVDKVYRATVAGRLGEKETAVFAAGVELGDFTAMSAALEILSAGDDVSVADVTVAEGKYHQVKRMFAATGHEVLRLHRRRFGPLELDPALAEGQWRELTAAETEALRKAAGMEDV